MKFEYLFIAFIILSIVGIVGKLLWDARHYDGKDIDDSNPPDLSGGVTDAAKWGK